MVDDQLRVFVILSPKCTKITTFLQITSKPENILKILQNNYNIFKNTYIPWLKVRKIYGISTPPDLLFCLSSSKTTSSLSGSDLKQQGLTRFKNLLSSPRQNCRPHQINLSLEVRFMQYPSLATYSIHPTN